MIRKGILLGITGLSSLLFIIQLISIQLINPRYKKLSENNAIIELPIFPERGLIFDRNKKLLVANQPAYDLMAIPENIKVFDSLELSSILGVTQLTLKKRLQSAKYFSRKLPSIIIPLLSKKQNALLQEKIWKYPGFYLQKKSVRDYRYPIASNVLGYISEVNGYELKRESYYSLGELIGRQGIEKSYEKQLRGKKGMRYLQKDRFNRILGTYENGSYDVPPENADNIVLTIDADLQRYGEELFQNKRGGIVALEPKTGEILALVTAPSYDPNLLVGRKRSKNYSLLLKDTIGKPLFDRGLQAEYAPGSPFKTLNALIALQEKVVTPETSFTCNAGHYYARGAFMACHCRIGSHNDLMQGIKNSCNTYFSKTYKKIIEAYPTPKESVDRWKDHLTSFGLGNYLGYDLPIGRPGLIPNGDYYNNRYQAGGWKSPTIISNAIGQGEILTTPIQMANFTAAIANRGYFVKPHFTRLKDSKKRDSLYPKKRTTIDEENFEIVIEGMHQVVENGTARIAKIKGIEVCGKTGTVENFTKIGNVKTQLTDHSMFIAFAPKDNPQIALAVFVENGYWGGRWAAPIASLMIEKHLTKQVKRKWLEKRMLNGSLSDEYKKPYLGVPFKINE